MAESETNSVTETASKTAIKMDGNVLAAIIKDEYSRRIEALKAKGVTPGLGAILVGDDAPSHKYVSMKRKDAERLGMGWREEILSADVTQEQVEAVVKDFNSDDSVHAFIIQYPFPKGLDYEQALMCVDPAKDADGLHPVNLGRLVQGIDAPLACTPAGIQRLLAHYDVPVEGSHMVIIGRGLTIGRPLANLMALKQKCANAAVTVVHTGVDDIAEHTRRADIIVAAAGFPGVVTKDMVKPGAAVVAAGVSFRDGKLYSDVDADVAEVAGWLSPKVGGVGPMTRAMLLVNTVEAAEASVS